MHINVTFYFLTDATPPPIDTVLYLLQRILRIDIILCSWLFGDAVRAVQDMGERIGISQL